MKYSLWLTTLSLATLVLSPITANAISLSIKQDGVAYTVVAVSPTGQGSLEAKQGKLTVPGTTAQLTVLGAKGPQGVVLGYKVGKSILTAKQVLANPAKFCANRIANLIE